MMMVMMMMMMMMMNEIFNRLEVPQGRIRDPQVAQEAFIIAPCFVGVVI